VGVELERGASMSEERGGNDKGERKKGYQQVQQEKDGKTKERLLLIRCE
jgi:hypothetical protein